MTHEGCYTIKQSIKNQILAIGQIELFSSDTATSLGEEKLNLNELYAA